MLKYTVEDLKKLRDTTSLGMVECKKFLEWYPESLAETLVDEEDLIWSHEGAQIALINVEVG